MNKDNQPATKKDLEKLVTKKEFKGELKKLVTKKEFKEELKKLATKRELRREVKDLRVELVGKMLDLDFKFEKRFGQMDQKIDDKFNKVLDGQDKIVGELRAMREEHSLLGGRVYDNTGRIEKIEEKVGIKASYEL